MFPCLDLRSSRLELLARGEGGGLCVLLAAGSMSSVHGFGVAGLACVAGLGSALTGSREEWRPPMWLLNVDAARIYDRR